MPNRGPRSYDEITRSTVPNPDSSFRPTKEQERQAFEGFRALDVDEQALSDRVHEALAKLQLRNVQIDVENDDVIVRGSVPDPAALARVLDLVRNVDGVGEVVDRLVIAAE